MLVKHVIGIILLATITPGLNYSYAGGQEVVRLENNLIIVVKDIVHTSEGKNNGKIEIQVQGGSGSLRINCFGPGMRDFKTDNQTNFVMDDLSPGTYTIAIEDEEFNHVHKTIVVK